jgi:hypothetical protein
MSRKKILRMAYELAIRHDAKDVMVAVRALKYGQNSMFLRDVQIGSNYDEAKNRKRPEVPKGNRHRRTLH